jgi:hypothetical protein
LTGAHKQFCRIAPEAVAFRKSLRVDLFEGFVMILDALVEWGQMRLSGTVDRAGFGHGVVQKKRAEKGPRSTGDP